MKLLVILNCYLIKKKEAEIAYFGILEEYFGKKLGGYLLVRQLKTHLIGWCKSLGSHLFSRSQKCLKKLSS